MQLTRDEDFERTRKLLGITGPPPAGANGSAPETFVEAQANPYPNLPDPLALQIVSSPGSAIVFFFEYIFATGIPSEIANDALVRLLNFLADTAKFLNSLDPPQPALLLVP